MNRNNHRTSWLIILPLLFLGYLLANTWAGDLLGRNYPNKLSLAWQRVKASLYSIKVSKQSDLHLSLSNQEQSTVKIHEVNLMQVNDLGQGLYGIKLSNEELSELGGLNVVGVRYRQKTFSSRIIKSPNWLEITVGENTIVFYNYLSLYQLATLYQHYNSRSTSP